MKRGYKDIMGQFGSDGYLYDFAKRSARDHMGSFGSDGYLYDFAKVNFLNGNFLFFGFKSFTI